MIIIISNNEKKSPVFTMRVSQNIQNMTRYGENSLNIKTLEYLKSREPL